MSDQSCQALYRRPPITEAIIDLRVELPEGFDASRLLKISQRLGGSYPKVEAINAATGQIQLVPPSSFVKTEAALAYGSEVRMESESRLIPNRSAFR